MLNHCLIPILKFNSRWTNYLNVLMNWTLKHCKHLRRKWIFFNNDEVGGSSHDSKSIIKFVYIKWSFLMREEPWLNLKWYIKTRKIFQYLYDTWKLKRSHKHGGGGDLIVLSPQYPVARRTGFCPLSTSKTIVSVNRFL